MINFKVVDNQQNYNWWRSLSDKQKYQLYTNIKNANESHANALHKIVEHLLGEGWYSCYNDIYSVNKDIVMTIYSRYPNIKTKKFKKFTDFIF